MERRALRKTPEFMSQAKQASQRAPRLLEAIAGAEFALVRHPDWGMPVRGTTFSSWPVHPAEDMTFKIVYSFNDREVVFRGLFPAVPPSGS
jgi:hypothetical protein